MSEKPKKRRVTKGLTTTHMPWRDRIRYLVVQMKMHGIEHRYMSDWAAYPDQRHIFEDHGNRQADKLERWLRKYKPEILRG